MLSRLPTCLPRCPGAALAAPLGSVALLVVLPLLTHHLPAADLLRSVQTASISAGMVKNTSTHSISLPLKGRLQNANQAFGSAQPALYRITPERRALLNTIRFAEGTWTEGRADGYRMLFGGEQVTDLARHPKRVVSRGHSSAAAGAYQFLPATWNEAAHRLRLPDFQPASQDQAALYLMEKRGALSRFDHQGLSHDVLALLAPEWASLPTARGESYYGQPVKGVQELRRFYSEDLERQRGRTV